MAPTYETATTRSYFHGRTETVRSCSVEAAAFCESMLNYGMSSSAACYDLLMKAHDKHLQMMTEAKQGKGVDRHLFGLYITAVENGFQVSFS